VYPHGIVYQSGGLKGHSEFILRPKLLARLGYHLLRTIGFSLVTFAITGVIFTFWPIIKDEFTYVKKYNEPISGFGELISEALAQKADEVKKETFSLGLNSYFSLNIPKIEAKANIIHNIDAGSPDEYGKALKEGIAHAKGTNFPGQGKTVYLFSHSTDSLLNFSRYNAIFYLLGKLEKGDRIWVYFLDKKYIYEVDQKLITQPNDTSWLKDSGQGERLILQTCYPPGTSLKRLLIIAVPVS
jgi:LPXTG-site transpeptidase (sortase) family protein